MIKKEFQSFFALPIGFLIVGLFLLFTSLFLFFFDTDFNILQAGYADLNSFFYFVPWIFIFFIPALTMRSFSEEIQTGTIEILKTKPISNWQIVKGKFISIMLIILIALIPTIIYFISIYLLANPVGNVDFATTIGSYIGLLFLAAVFVAVGLFCSILTTNQIVSFLLAICISFLLFYLFELIGKNNFIGDFSLKKLSLYAHFENVSKGLIDSRDIIYFLSITFLFLFLTKLKLEKI